MKKYIFLKHTADMKFQAFGKDIAECFKNSAYAFREIITKSKIKQSTKKTIRTKGKDSESLLYNFLEEFIFLMDTKNLIMAEVDSIEIEKNKNGMKLKSVIYFDSIKKYKTITDIKAVTYNDMFVKFDEKKKKCVCQVVVDV